MGGNPTWKFAGNIRKQCLGARGARGCPEAGQSPSPWRWHCPGGAALSSTLDPAPRSLFPFPTHCTDGGQLGQAPDQASVPSTPHGSNTGSPKRNRRHVFSSTFTWSGSGTRNWTCRQGTCRGQKEKGGNRKEGKDQNTWCCRKGSKDHPGLVGEE